MELQISPKDTDVLLKQKNVLNEDVLNKYRFAGQVSQTCLTYLISLINDSYHFGKHEQYTAAELCLLGDSFMKTALKSKYKKGVKEKGIAQPVTIDVNDIVVGYSPELDDDINITFKAGDIVTINLGCHIDGYTSNLSHTIVIYPPGVAAEDGHLKPTGPLLGSPADAICASYIASETIVALLGASMTPEKIPKSFSNGQTTVTGTMIRDIVDSIAESFNCIVVPTSKIRRIRRFLAGQAEGTVAERDFKGVVWSESDQELRLLEKSSKFDEKNRQLAIVDKSKSHISKNSTAIPTDDFSVLPGEVYMIDIKMSPLDNESAPGLITLETLDHYSGKNNSKECFNPRNTIFVRDVSMSEHLKIKSARKLLSTVDTKESVYPFKLSHISDHFPLSMKKNVIEQLQEIQKDMKSYKLGLSEVVNKHLFVAKPILAARFIALPIILNATTSTGINGYDASNPTLPGLELPLPRLGITALKLKTMLKSSKRVPVARELSTVVLNNEDNELLRLSGGSKTSKPSWVHSVYQVQGKYSEGIQELIQLTQDERFGIKIKECQPMSIDSEEAVAETEETMQM